MGSLSFYFTNAIEWKHYPDKRSESYTQRVLRISYDDGTEMGGTEDISIDELKKELGLDV